jgi:glycosyltransferase involved in cell wall biosynthesis
MKVLHVPFTYSPDAVGGTEIYVAALAHRLRAREVESVIAAPARDDAEFVREGSRVRRYACNDEISDLRDLYGEGDALAAASFERVLESERPDVVHLHAHTRGVSLRALRRARQRGIPVVYTFHTPTATCQRGTLLRWGNEVCDGVMHASLCAACSLHGHGLPPPLARLFAAIPASVGASLGRAGLKGRLGTVCRSRELVALRHRTTRAFLHEVDHVVAVCAWVREVLLRNGVPAEKVTLCRQGLCQEPIGPKAEIRKRKADVEVAHLPLRVAFLGRLDPTKGVEVLLRAARALPDTELTLDIFGIAQGESGRRYETSLRQLAAGDRRIAFHPAVPAAQVVETLRGYHLLAVPSQWMETGPMVVLEAFAAGVPVLGSRLGGITELVRDGIDGRLVEAADPREWSAALRQFASNPDLRARLRVGIRPPRTMEQVTDETAALYERLLV